MVVWQARNLDTDLDTDLNSKNSFLL